MRTAELDEEVHDLLEQRIEAVWLVRPLDDREMEAGGGFLHEVGRQPLELDADDGRRALAPLEDLDAVDADAARQRDLMVHGLLRELEFQLAAAILPGLQAPLRIGVRKVADRLLDARIASLLARGSPGRVMRERVVQLDVHVAPRGRAKPRRMVGRVADVGRRINDGVKHGGRAEDLHDSVGQREEPEPAQRRAGSDVRERRRGAARTRWQKRRSARKSPRRSPRKSPNSHRCAASGRPFCCLWR